MKNNKPVELFKKFMDKPLLFGIVISLLFMGALKLTGLIMYPFSEEVEWIGDAALIIIFVGLYIWYRIAYKKEIPHTFSVKTFFKGCLFVLPFFIFSIVTFLSVIVMVTAAENTLPPVPFIIRGLIKAMEAGICEDIVLRGLFSGNAMRVKHESKDILFNAFASSIIFGLLHLFNLTAGAGFTATMSQVMYSMGFGMIFAAAFFRTGSIIPGIVAHTLLDFGQFMTAGTVNGANTGSIGVIADSNPASQIALGVILLGVSVGYALILLRKKKRGEIVSIFTVNS